jgi:hypothetical protein
MRGACKTNANGELRIVHKNWLENSKEEEHFENIDEDGRIITKWILNK